MKRVLVVLTALALAALALTAIYIFNASTVLRPKPPPEKVPLPFLVGVTYCGNTTEEAKLLIDKVKGYTNFFVLQSGELQLYPNKINEICDYAASAGLYFMVYFGSGRSGFFSAWSHDYDGRWGDKYVGIYYGDEPGGKMLDSNASFNYADTRGELKKNENGSVTGQLLDGSRILYQPNGVMITTQSKSNYTEGKSVNDTIVIANRTFTTYYPDGIVTVEFQEYDGPITLVDGSTNVAYTYEELWNARPFQTYRETAGIFIENYSNDLARTRDRPNEPNTIITSDYALYWFDLLAGYDMVLAQFGWNNTIAQEIALARGAANLQNKTWGAMITWTYTQPPYLTNGERMYDQMLTAYENGADCILIFNYAPQPTTQYGILQEEHFTALQRFWNEAVQNPEAVHDGVKAEAALVLPKDYGWGMRNPNDKIWGLWQADEKSAQIWNALQEKLTAYGSRIDIVYDDPEYPVAGKYPEIYYWNQTG